MLKALDIVGFKSFADRTRFEFPHGITAVVGPNGSGKSNIVDAIKWVLGEQSVKSLRGHEMTDVIFNGSGARRPMNTAEITLTFDNSKRLLAVDAPEVHITRRVYRGGEGEYLINRNPARLRDIRDLLSGTGMGTQAYSVIEQGKVDVLLQSSPRDRRVIFEEAAGTSRFKIRKVEALRRLERVEQNLLRLSDIVEEVEGRLRGVRTQAGKARRYREYADRLQELRTQTALVDWKRFSGRLADLEKELHALGDEHDAATAEAESLGAQSLEIDARTAEINEEIRRAESQIAANRERIAAAESAIDHERRRTVDLDQEIARHRQQLTALSARAGDLRQQLEDTTKLLESAEHDHGETVQGLAEAEQGMREIAASLEQCRSDHESHRTAHLRWMRESAATANEIGALESEAAADEAVGRRSAERMAELDRTLDALQRELEELRSRRTVLTRRVEEQSQSLANAREQLAQSQREHALRQAELAEMRQRRAGAAERAAVLEELVRRHDGISEGVRGVLAMADDPANDVFRDVAGLVADLLHVGVEAAPLIEIALGAASQHVVATRTQKLLDYLQTEAGKLGGRVGFLWLNEKKLPSTREEGADIDIEGRPGVLGRADRFVETQSCFAPLAHRLLGRTWFVEKLHHAAALAQSVGGQLTYVTAAGERLEPDGTLVVGPRSAAAGLISRRSQWRALLVQLDEWDAAIQVAEEAVARGDEQIALQRGLVEKQSAEHARTADALAENRLAVAAAEERRNQWDRQRAVLERERCDAQRRHAAAAARLADLRQKQKQIEAATTEAETVVERLRLEIEAMENRRAAADREITDLKVRLAKGEERLQNLLARMRQFEETQQERSRAVEETQERLADFVQRAETSRQNTLSAASEVAQLYLSKETFAVQAATWVERRETLQRQRDALSTEIQKLQGRVRRLEEKAHAAELAAGEVRHERTALADRFREDYGVELAELDRDVSDEQQHQREAAQQEIEELRQKINGLGNVNLESLDELDQLEARHKTLADQHADLASAKTSLESIIEKINDDSRRLFAETLEVVRGHFQTLFRDLFGGGRADIVLEEGVDLLDSGIEIVARPPGKEPRSISLLSGGEKTMTCVALLLAIFRSRPSPFCVLDEVDAALDEANIERFTKVLKDFLAWTQFIIVTHSKKTMTCADTIYGVTMQESGITKQVSVRFEDVSADGQWPAAQSRAA